MDIFSQQPVRRNFRGSIDDAKQPHERCIAGREATRTIELPDCQIESGSHRGVERNAGRLDRDISLAEHMDRCIGYI